MRKLLTLVAAVALLLGVGMAANPAVVSATIHPIVESFDCANEQAFAHHPYGDPAEVPGQNPAVGNHSDQSSLRALDRANEKAFSGHKLNGECGHAGD